MAVVTRNYFSFKKLLLLTIIPTKVK